MADRCVFGVWRFAPFGSADVMFGPAADDALGAPAIRSKNESHAKASPTRQRRRPPPVAETGRSCWGSGQQGASALHEATAGSRNPDRWHRASAMMTERFCTKKRPHHSKEQWGRFTILQWVPLTQPWGPREPLPPQPLRRALPERQERQRASEPASPRAWGDSDRPSAGRG